MPGGFPEPLLASSTASTETSNMPALMEYSDGEAPTVPGPCAAASPGRRPATTSPHPAVAASVTGRDDVGRAADLP